MEDGILGCATPEGKSGNNMGLAAALRTPDSRAADEFRNKGVAPNLEEIGHGNRDVAVQVLKKSEELGLTAILTPERYSGMELDLASTMIAAEYRARDGS